MLAYMNEEALARTIDTGEAHYWTRSRNALWRKGEESGNAQRVVEMRTDCDQDAIWLKVEIGGAEATCHTGRKSCFYRASRWAPQLGGGARRCASSTRERLFDPEAVYRHARAAKGTLKIRSNMLTRLDSSHSASPVESRRTVACGLERLGPPPAWALSMVTAWQDRRSASRLAAARPAAGPISAC